MDEYTLHDDIYLFRVLYLMEQLLTHPEKVQEMAYNARPLIVERYEQKKVWKALLEEYRKLLEEKKY